MAWEETYAPGNGETDWYAQTLADVAVLEKTASRLRRLGWFWIFWLGMMMLLGLVFVGFGILKAVFFFGFVGFVAFIVSMFYFGLARHVAGGRRWAIALATCFVTLLIAAVVYGIVNTDHMHPGFAVFETLYLVAMLNFLKNLVQSWAAASRIRRMQRRMRENLPLDFDAG